MTDPADDDTVRVPAGSRRKPSPEGNAADADQDGITSDGSTVIARRESRRRQKRAHSDVPKDGRAGGPPALDGSAGVSGKEARTPDASPAISGVRVPAPAMVPRAASVPRVPQEVVDTAAGETARRRRSRRLFAIVVVSASVVLAVATVLLVILLAIR